MSLADLAHLSPGQQRELAWFGAAQGQTDPKQLPGKPQVWKVGGRFFVAYYIPGTSVPMVWEATEQELRDKYGGVDAPMPAIDRQMDEAQFRKLSPWLGGRISELRNTSDDPWSQFFADYRKSADLRPWLNDPDMLATIVTAYLEGRDPTPDELSQTKWWQTHTAAERKWLEESVTLGEAELGRRQSDAERIVTDQLLALGAKTVGQEVIRLIASRWITGQWSEQYVKEQINKVADPYGKGELNKVLADALDAGRRTTRVQEDVVRETAIRWLGPTMGNMTQQDVERWAGRFRNNPDAMVDFEEHLRKQRLALFPKFNENLTYEDIVAPVRNLATNIWGQPITNETLLVDLANLGDYTEAAKRLRHQGLQNNIGKVVQDALGELSSTALGDRVARSTI